MNRHLRRSIWLALIVIGLLLLTALAVGGVEPALSVLRQLEAVVDDHFWLALTGFILSFIILVILGLPVGTLYCLCAGYLFGILVGTLAALAGASIGALTSFSMVRRLGGRRLREHLGMGIHARLLTQLERDAGWYLILLRIIPFAPFFPVNAAAAMTRVGPGLFGVATLIGLIPTTLIYAAIGNGLGSTLEAGELVTPGVWLNPAIWTPLSALLALLAFGLYWHHRYGHRP